MPRGCSFGWAYMCAADDDDSESDVSSMNMHPASVPPHTKMRQTKLYEYFLYKLPDKLYEPPRKRFRQTNINEFFICTK